MKIINSKYVRKWLQIIFNVRTFYIKKNLFLTEIVVGVVSSSILTDEPFGWREIVGSSMIILGGILAVVLAPKEDKKITA